LTDTAREHVTSVQEEKLALEQLRLALRNLRPNCWIMPILAAVMSVMFSRWVDRLLLGFWFGLVTVGGSYLGVVAYTFGRKAREVAQRRMWAAHASAAYLLFAGSWSSFGFLFWRGGDDLNHMLIMLIIACTLAGNAALVGASRTLTVIGFAVHGSVLILAPLREGGTIYDGLAILAFLYVCYMAYMSRQIYSTARDMLLLRDAKNDLIHALEKSKLESDRARQRAEAASRAKSEFLANMSHELRTPLNAIIGFSEMIFSPALRVDNAKQAEYAKLVHKSGGHLLALINDMLDLAKIEAGKLELKESDVNLKRVLCDAVRLMSANAESAGLTLRTDIAGKTPVLRADERALRQIVLNLLSNALKFTPAGGDVVVFCRIEPTGDVAIGVHDTGVGIETLDQIRVFQNFGQGRHDVVMADKGTGLGLPIVKGLCEAHGGRVELESSVGEGTRVTVIFPAARARPRLQRAS
jgi:two-component system cell cycle sensor histidine kinase PleC